MGNDGPMESLASKKAVVLAIIAFLVLLAWANRFIQDDAFISFRYADNLANGHGLVWNPGEEPVEGYTNPSWTLLIGAALILGLEPITASYVFGLLAFLGSLLLVRRLGILLFDSQAIAMLGLVLLGTNYTFSSFATGGLETQLQVCLCLATWTLVFQRHRAGSWETGAVALASLAAGAAMTTRLDSVVLLALPLFFAFVGILREPVEPSRRVLRVAALVLPFVTVFGGWLLWKQAYYGDILPNTYYAKVSAGPPATWGIAYVYRFFVSYWLAPFPFMLAIVVGRLFKRLGPIPFLALIPTFVLWTLYVVKVGGGFMEFRFMVPILPIFFMMIAWFILSVLKTGNARVIVAALVIAGSVQHVKTFGVVVDRGLISTIASMQTWLYEPDKNWIRIGELLGERLPEGSDVSIGVTAAGAIPYYSKLHTIDMLGLNDKWIARNGTYLGGVWGNQKPGHLLGATFEYMTSRGTHLVLGHPFVVEDPRLTRQAFMEKHYAEEYVNERYFYGTALPGALAQSRATLIRIPIEHGYSVLAVYLAGHPHVDELIRNGEWEVIPIASEVPAVIVSQDG